MVTALRGPLLVFFLPAPMLAPLARNARVRAAARHAAPPARRVLALGGEPRDLARPVPLRPRARAPEPARLRARLLDVLRDPRLDAARRSGLAPPAEPSAAASRWRRRCSRRGRSSPTCSSSRSRRSTRSTTAPTGSRRSPTSSSSGIVMMVEQLLTLGTCVALLLRPRWRRARAARLAAPHERERHRVQLRAALPRARRRRRRRSTGAPRARDPPAALAHRRVRLRVSS